MPVKTLAHPLSTPQLALKTDLLTYNTYHPYFSLGYLTPVSYTPKTLARSLPSQSHRA